MSQFRNIMMTKIGGGGVLPSGYLECEYLIASNPGSAYINTGFIPSNNTIVEADMRIGRNGTLIGSDAGWLKNGYFLSYFYFSQGSQFNKHSMGNVYCHVKIQDGILYADGVPVITLHPNTFVGQYPLYLFANDRNGSPSEFSVYGEIGRLRIEDTDRQMFLIPALDANGTPCMYDTISKTTFYNNGTGMFGYRLK